MIIGDGLLGRCFKKNGEYNNHLIFTSGVSNSKETNQDFFDREKDLVIKTIRENKDLIFVYFSSVLVGINKNKYYNHKLEIEELIKKETDNYIIFRIPQVIGYDGNKNNLINKIKDSINNYETIIIYRDINRSLLDVDDLVDIVNYCKDKTTNTTLFISGIELVSVLELVNGIGLILNKYPITKTEDSIEDNNWDFDNSQIIKEAIIWLKINETNYTNKTIKKYIK